MECGNSRQKKPWFRWTGLVPWLRTPPILWAPLLLDRPGRCLAHHGRKWCRSPSDLKLMALIAETPMAFHHPNSMVKLNGMIQLLCMLFTWFISWRLGNMIWVGESWFFYTLNFPLGWPVPWPSRHMMVNSHPLKGGVRGGVAISFFSGITS